MPYLETLLPGAVDTAMAAQNTVVALESLGLSAVYAGGIRNKPAEVAREQNMPERDWSEQAVHRVSGPETLSGRHLLRDILHGLGFGLK